MSSFLSVRPQRTGACFSVRKGSPQQDTGTGGAPQGAKAGSAGAFCRAGRGPPRRGSADRCRTPYPPRNYRPARDGHFSPAQSGQKANVERPFPGGSRQARDPRLPSSTPANRHGTPPVVRRRTGTGPVKAPAGDPCRKTPPATQPAAGAMAAPLPPACPGRRKAANRLPDSSQMAAKQFHPCRSAAADMNGPRTDAEHPTWTDRRRQAKSRRSRRSGGS